MPERGADVADRHCVRFRAGGEVLATIDLDRGAFAGAKSSCSCNGTPKEKNR